MVTFIRARQITQIRVVTTHYFPLFKIINNSVLIVFLKYLTILMRQQSIDFFVKTKKKVFL